MKISYTSSFLIALIVIGAAAGEEGLGFLASSRLRGRPANSKIPVTDVSTELSERFQGDFKEMSVMERSDYLGDIGEALSETIEGLSEMDFSEYELLDFLSEKAIEEGKATMKLIADASYFLREAANDNLQLPESNKKTITGATTDQGNKHIENKPHDLEKLSRILKEAKEEEENQSEQRRYHRRTSQSEFRGDSHPGSGFGGRFHTNRLFHINKMQDAIRNGDEEYLNGVLDKIHRRMHPSSSTKKERERRRMQEENNKIRQCEQLVDCAGKMSRYDMFAFFYSDDIDSTNGEVDGNVFQFDEEDLKQKRQNIRNKVDELQHENGSFNYNSGKCNGLLREFHRQKEVGGIPDWEGGFVGQVCLAEGTTQYIKYEDLVTNVANGYPKPSFTSNKCSNNKDKWDKYRCNVVGYLGGYGDDKCKSSDKGIIQQYLVEPFECAREIFKDQVTQGDQHFPFLKNYDQAYGPSKDFRSYYFPNGINRAARDVHGQLRDATNSNLDATNSNHPWELEDIKDLNERFEQCIKAEVGEGRPDCSKTGNDKTGYGKKFVKAVDVCVGRVLGKAVDHAIQVGIGQEVSPGFLCGQKNAVVNDNKSLPGTCCLDASWQFEDQEWGMEFDCDAVECRHYGPLFSGFNEESCNHHGGNYCPLPADCEDLQVCVAQYIDEANATDLYAYRDYLEAAPSINDHTDPYECGRAREYFGFEDDFLDDNQICQDIDQLRYSRDFDFLNEFFGEGGGATSQIEGCDGEFYTTVPPLCLKQADDSLSQSSVVQNGQAWRSTNFAFEKVVETYYSFREAANAVPCGCSGGGDPGMCTIYMLCDVAKSTFQGIMETIRFVIELSHGVSVYTYGEEAEWNNIQPIETWENTQNIYGNMEKTAVYLQERFEDVADNTTVTHEKLDEIQETLEELVDADDTATINGKLDDIQATLDEFVAPDLKDRKFAGCDKFDQNGINNEDDCAEDLYPPNIVVHDLVPYKSYCNNDMKCIDKDFKSLDDSITYLESAVSVVDDCGHPSSLSMTIDSETLGECAAVLTVTPNHTCQDGDGTETIFTGDSFTFLVDVDEDAPTITCTFDMEIVESDDRFRMVGPYLIVSEDGSSSDDFFQQLPIGARPASSSSDDTDDDVLLPIVVTTAETCSDEVDIIVTVQSDTLAKQDTVLVVDEETVVVTPKTCDDLIGFCKENEEHLILYKIEIQATDQAGHASSATCQVVVEGEQNATPLTVEYLQSSLSQSRMYKVTSYEGTRDIVSVLSVS